MSKYTEAAEAAKNLHNSLRGVMLVGEQLEELGSIEDRKHQLEREVKTVTEARDQAQAQLQQSKDAIAEEQRVFKEQRAIDQREHDERMEKLSVDAFKLIADTKAQAESLRQEAEGELASLHAEIEEAKVEREALNEEVKTAQERLDDAEESFEALKRRIK